MKCIKLNLILLMVFTCLNFSPQVVKAEEIPSPVIEQKDIVIPESITFLKKGDGTITVQDYIITNNTDIDMALKSVSVKANNGWLLQDDTYNFNLDDKSIILKVKFNENEDWQILKDKVVTDVKLLAKTSIKIDFNIKLGIYTNDYKGLNDLSITPAIEDPRMDLGEVPGTVKGLWNPDTKEFVLSGNGTIKNGGVYRNFLNENGSGVITKSVEKIIIKGNFKLPENAPLFYAFGNLTKVKEIIGLENIDTSNVKHFKNMFVGCRTLTSLTGLEKWDVSSVTDMSGMFFSCVSIADFSPLANWNTSNVTNMSDMFYDAKSLTNLNGLDNWNVSSVMNMSGIFDNCILLEDISNIKNWNVSNVTNMSSMFQKTKIFDLEPLLNWNVSNVTNMSSLFASNTNIITIFGLENWNVSNVVNMNQMFSMCTSLKFINSILDWKVNEAVTTSSMFAFVETKERPSWYK